MLRKAQQNTAIVLMAPGSASSSLVISGWGFEMPKRSGYAIALGLHGQRSPATNRNLARPGRAVVPRSAADGFYFQLETFLDTWRREGMEEDVVRAALERAKRASLAMENVGKRLRGR